MSSLAKEIVHYIRHEEDTQIIVEYSDLEQYCLQALGTTLSVAREVVAALDPESRIK